MERTFAMLKPDCVQRGLLGRVMAGFEEKGLKVVACKMIRMNEKMCREHYAHHADKPFFGRLVKFMTSAPVLCLALEGKEAVEVLRSACGATNARAAAPGTIRGDFGLSVQSNIIHASDSKETAEREIARFFKKEEIFDYKRIDYETIYAEDERE